MSYTFNNTGGTNHGIKTYDQIFALNRTTSGASNYWNPKLISGDTVIMELQYTHASSLMRNHKILTYYDFDQGGSFVQGKHWIGNGLYMCYNNSGSNINPGDFVCQWSGSTAPAAAGTRPIIDLSTSSTDSRYPLGVAVERSANGSMVMVAMMGVWPCKRFGTLALDVPMYLRTSNNQITQTNPNAGQRGALGKCIEASFPIIDSVDADPETSNGALIAIWGTSTEQY